MEPIRTIRSRAVRLPEANIATDRIIPAQFLTGTAREGLGKHLFAGWRRGADGKARPDFPLNRPEAAGAGILVAGDNFGCGSSREHAVWALLDAGFRAVVSTSLADIFRANSLRNGLLPVAVGAPFHARLLSLPADAEIEINLATRTIALPDGSRESFPVDPFARRCLLEGIDALDFLLRQHDAIAAYERRAGG